MKKIVSLLLFFVLCVGMCACGKEENNPEMIVRNTCFDQYYDSSATGYEKFKGETVGYIVALLAKDSFVYISRDNLERLWTEEWTVNENIPFFDEVTAAYNYDSKKEDLLCITLLEHITYQSEDDNTFSCVFTIDKDSDEVVPIMFFGTKNGKLTSELTVDSPQVTVSAFYIMLKYSILDVEYLREVEYSAYN